MEKKKKKLKKKILWTGGNPVLAEMVLIQLAKNGYSFFKPLPKIRVAIDYIIVSKDSIVEYWMNEGDQSTAADCFMRRINEDGYEALKVSKK